MALTIIFFAAILAACANFFLKKNQDNKGSPQAFLVFYYLFALITSIFLTPSIFHIHWNFSLSFLGGIAGILNVLMMGFTALALFTGPPGLTFAFQNAGAVVPAILLFFLFGPSYDFIFTTNNIIGLLAVVVGLFLGARTKQSVSASAVRFKFKKWIIFALGIFLLQGAILSMFQWRCLLYIPDAISHPYVPFTCPANEDVWFIPGFFVIAFLCQIFIFGLKERRWPTKREFIYGSVGGVLNGIITFCLLYGTKTAVGTEKAILFPSFAVAVIFFCSIWGRILYKENVNWLAIALCIFGVFFSLL